MNGFDDIINSLDGWINRVEEPPAPPKPEAPTFKVGDVIVIRETRWPPENGRINERTGLYKEPGYPKLGNPRYAQQADEVDDFRWDPHDRLQEKLTGTVAIGDVCKIIAVWCHEDGKSYYFLDNGTPRGKGWTRCSFRFRHAIEEERLRR